MTRLKLKVFTAVFCCGLWSHAQIKIGDHPEQIAPGSVLELESEERVLVITRVSTGQMNEISPLAGALAFNTDTGCIHFFDGAAWRNLCESPGLLLSAEPKVNPFPTLLLTPDEAGLHLEVSEISGEQVADFSIGPDDLKNGAVTAEKLDSLSVGDAAMDYGAITLNDFENDAGYVRREELVSQDPGNSLAERRGVFYDDSDLRTAVEQLASDFEKDLDRDAANELQQLTLANGLLSISDGNSVDLSPVLGTGTDSQNLLGAGLSGTTLKIDIERGASVSVDLDPGFVSETEWADFLATDRDLDPANELQTISSSDGSVRITPAGKDFDLSVSGGGTDDQDLTSATLTGTALTISIENGASVTADLSALATDAELAALPLDDADADPANELQTISSSDGSVRITPSGKDFDLSVSGGGTDDQDLTSATLTGTDLTISIENGASVTADLSALATDAELAALPLEDADADPTNELQTISSSDGSVRITPSGKDFDLSVSGGGTDDQDLTSATLAGTDLTISIENGASVTADLSALATDAELAALPLDDADADPANELQMISSSDGSVRITPAGKDFDLSVSGGGTDDQDLTSATLAGTDLTISIENGASVTADLSALATDAELAALPLDDADADPANELQSLSSPDGSVTVQRIGNDYELSVAAAGAGSNLANSNLIQTGGDRVYDLAGQNLSIDGSGSVGIGTLSPQSKLHVSGQIRSSGYANSNGVVGEPSYAFTNDSDTGMWRGSRVNYLRFSTGGVEALTIDPNQNVGIGVDSPTERLEVAGNILASGSVTPDYVFDTYYGGGSAGIPSYKFRKLEEVEAYLRRHRHLPGVPSAREVAKAGGILVNRATEVNLEKIEELYLYLLEQQQQLRSLQNEYKLLASQVRSLKKQNPVQP